MYKLYRAEKLLEKLNEKFSDKDEYDVPYNQVYIHELKTMSQDVVWHDEIKNPIYLAGILKHNMLGCFGDCFEFTDEEYLEMVSDLD